MIKNVATRNISTKQTEKMNKVILELQGEIGRLEEILETNSIEFNRADILSRL